MTSLRPMTATDLYQFNSVNLDSFTETFLQSFYLRYLTNWPELCVVADAPDGTLAGYIIGTSCIPSFPHRYPECRSSLTLELKISYILARLLQPSDSADPG